MKLPVPSLASILLVWLPWLLAGFYWGHVSSDRYVSESRFVLQHSGNEQATGFQLATLIGGSGGTTTRDALMVREHILSRDMLAMLDNQLHLREHYSDKARDWFSRLQTNASREDFFDYFNSRVTVVFEEVSSVLTIRAEAFTPEMAKGIVQAIVNASEEFINTVGQQLAMEQVNFATGQLERTHNQMNEAKREILSFQNEHELVSPEYQTKAVSSIVSTMESDVAMKQAELKSLRSYLNGKAPEVIRLRSEISSIKSQIESEKKKLIGDQGDKLNTLNSEFEDLKMNTEFRMDAYSSTLKALEMARVEASHKLKHLIVLESPGLPEEARYPRRIYNFVTFAAVSLLIYWASLLAIATVRDHRE